VITDYLNKWVEVVALPDQTVLSTCKALVENIINYHEPHGLLLLTLLPTLRQHFLNIIIIENKALYHHFLSPAVEWSQGKIQ
jgi:hypothetical protein